MLLLEYFKKESTTSLQKMVFMAVVAGVSNGMILMLINASAENAWNEDVNFKYLLLYGIALVLFIYTKKMAMSDATVVVEQVIRNVRVRIANKIRHADLPFVEKLGPQQVYTTVAQDTNLISQTAIVMINAASSAIMLVASLLYIAYVSMIAFLITMVSIALALSIYIVHRKELMREVELSNQKEAEFFESLNHILEGFKQLKMNKQRSDSVYHSLQDIALDTEALKVSTGLRITLDFMFSQVFYYSLIAVVLFVLPTLDPGHAPLVMKLTAAVLFIIGPLDTVVGSFPLFARSTVAIKNIKELEHELDTVVHEDFEDTSTVLPIFPFETIELDRVRFDYKNDIGDTLFTLGPVDLTIRQGEILYIVGGNGSGKSTLLKTLTRLYRHTSGELRINGERLSEAMTQQYRELFSVVFTDFHLFDRLYGLNGDSDTKVNSLLKKMGISGKTSFADGRFSNLKLSTGQRKRLALIVSFLEDKHICIFDECAADQDPEFKKYFYEVLLKELQAQGKTIIAVTHDDNYFHTADRVVKMNYGRLEEYV